jgi:NAD(P)H-dependent flavin oxidoreductase YrpB (nitropropane dioxygenase family)
LRNALAFRRRTGASLPAFLREGLALKEGSELTWSQLVMAANAPMMTRAALVEGRLDAGILPTGQVVGSIDELPTVAELVARIVRQANAVLERLGSANRGSTV